MTVEIKHPVGFAGVIVAGGGSSDRLTLIPSSVISDWYLPYNARNDNAFAEGTWEMWVMLAKEILELEERRSSV